MSFLWQILIIQQTVYSSDRTASDFIRSTVHDKTRQFKVHRLATAYHTANVSVSHVEKRSQNGRSENVKLHRHTNSASRLIGTLRFTRLTLIRSLNGAFDTMQMMRALQWRRQDFVTGGKWGMGLYGVWSTKSPSPGCIVCVSTWLFARRPCNVFVVWYEEVLWQWKHTHIT